MRKVTQESASAFWNSKNYRANNTKVTAEEFENMFSLHGNLIARYNKKQDKLFISDCGWKTQITRERLNGILSHINMKLETKKGEWFLIGKGEKLLFQGSILIEVGK